MKGEWLLVAACLVAFVPSVRADGSEETAVQEFAKMPPKLTLESSAADVLRACREMLPTRPVELKGALIRGETNLLATVSVSRRGARPPTIQLAKADAPGEATVPSLLERVMETDVTWLDLTFDFLWWTDAAYETEREGESVHGQKCSVILVKPAAAIPGLAGVRLWADRKTGCLMQAEQLDGEMKPMRRLWGTRVKKFDGERWMVSVLEVETLGSRHRTKITVDSLRELEN